MTPEGADGSVALVTGGGSGIGEACVKRFYAVDGGFTAGVVTGVGTR